MNGATGWKFLPRVAPPSGRVERSLAVLRRCTVAPPERPFPPTAYCAASASQRGCRSMTELLRSHVVHMKIGVPDACAVASLVEPGGRVVGDADAGQPRQHRVL